MPAACNINCVGLQFLPCLIAACEKNSDYAGRLARDNPIFQKCVQPYPQMEAARYS